MSFTRIQYDNCAYAEKINNSQKPMYYHLFKGQAEQCDACVSSNGPRNYRVYNNSEITTVKRETPLDMTLMTEVDSLLSNRGYPNSRCMTERTLEEKQKKLKEIPLGPHARECDKAINSEYSRLNIPVDNFRGIYIDRWETPIIDPKNWVPKDTGFGRNTKLAVRDTYKPIKSTPMPETAMPKDYTPIDEDFTGILKVPYSKSVDFKLGINSINKKF
jgi:hypothetical protein